MQNAQVIKKEKFWFLREVGYCGHWAEYLKKNKQNNFPGILLQKGKHCLREYLHGGPKCQALKLETGSFVVYTFIQTKLRKNRKKKNSISSDYRLNNSLQSDFFCKFIQQILSP